MTGSQAKVYKLLQKAQQVAEHNVKLEDDILNRFYSGKLEKSMDVERLNNNRNKLSGLLAALIIFRVNGIDSYFVSYDKEVLEKIKAATKRFRIEHD